MLHVLVVKGRNTPMQKLHRVPPYF